MDLVKFQNLVSSSKQMVRLDKRGRTKNGTYVSDEENVYYRGRDNRNS